MPASNNGMLQERVDRLETKVDELGIKIDRLTTRVDHLETRFGHLEIRFDRLETKFDGLATEVKVLSDRTGRVEVQLDDLRDTLNNFTNTMGARFDAIDRRLEENQKQFLAKVLDHDLVLTNHNKRITVLERRPRRRT